MEEKLKVIRKIMREEKVTFSKAEKMLKERKKMKKFRKIFK